MGMSREVQEAEFEREMARAAARPQADEPRVEYDEPEREASVEEMLAEIETLKKQEQVQALKTELRARKAALQEQQQARASVPRHDPDRDSPNTWILIPHDQAEGDISETWIDEHCPAKKEQRMLESVLNMSQLRQEDSIMCMVRGHGKRQALTLQETKLTDQGERLSTPRPVAALLAEMVLTPPIHLRDHWVVGGGFGRYSGRVNQASLVAAIGAVCAPLQPKFLDVASATKGNLPQELVLRYL